MISGAPPDATLVTVAVLIVVLLIGVAAGRAKGRWMLLAVGIVLIFAVGVVLTAVGTGSPPGTPAPVGPAPVSPVPDDPGAELAALYTITIPLTVAFLGGWLMAHGSWVRRFIVFAAAVLVLAAFPYAVAGQATADTFLRG